MKNKASSIVAVIGDLVGSRQQASRSQAQTALLDALAVANEWVTALQPLESTIGDEFQGVYDCVESAATAVLLVRLALPEEMDCRAGIGRGPIEIVGTSRYGLTQDGPAWWSARDAIVDVKEGERRLPGLRTTVAEGDAWMNSYLMTRDAIVTGFDGRQRRLALGVLQGSTRADLARIEGISASAVSQSLRRSGAAAVLESVGVLTGSTGANR